MTATTLNFHHLHYFWAVAKDGNLTRTAARLRVSQSALSAQIRQLEDALGEALFHRTGRTLALSEAGGVALQYAETIFGAGAELVATLQRGRGRDDVLKIGAVATLSRNFQESFVQPLLGEGGIPLRLQSGRLDDLLEGLAGHDLDLVLSNRPMHREPGRAWRCRRIARQAVSLVGRPRATPVQFDADLATVPMILPGPDSEIRTEFDALCEQRGIAIRVLAEVDDMATMRLLARDTDAVALLPSVVIRDEIRSGELCEYGVVPGLFETFYAITVERRFQHPRLRSLLARDEADVLAMDPQSARPPRGQRGGAARTAARTRLRT
jgi:LysR family transcriptional regulator, transcriptional activator of nhaA